jgi:hypothetical protein
MYWSDLYDPVKVEVTESALLLIAAGRGPARLPTCEHTLRHSPVQNYNVIYKDQHYSEGSDSRRHGPNAASSVAVRAVSLFGPGELRALRLSDAGVFRIVAERLKALPSSGSGSATAQMASQALDSLCAVELAPLRWVEDRCVSYATAILEHCAATITELKGASLPGRVLCESDSSGRPSVLARCTRLERLSDAFIYTPAVWLGLSQLHTLEDVDLNKVSVAAIAAALPKLRTLKAYCDSDDSGSAAGFFTDLLPRLWAFHFHGVWPVEVIGFAAPQAAPLPVLEELVWQEEHKPNRPPQPTVLRGFQGSRPRVLHAPTALIVECLPGRSGIPREPASNALTRVCDLRIYPSVNVPFDMADVAQVLVAAPQLRKFTVPSVTGDTLWLTTCAGPLAPAFAGLVHPRLRYFTVRPGFPQLSSRDDGCVSRLRRTCFPRLQVLEVDGETFLATTHEEKIGKDSCQAQ